MRSRPVRVAKEVGRQHSPADTVKTPSGLSLPARKTVQRGVPGAHAEQHLQQHSQQHFQQYFADGQPAQELSRSQFATTLEAFASGSSWTTLLAHVKLTISREQEGLPGHSIVHDACLCDSKAAAGRAGEVSGAVIGQN